MRQRIILASALLVFLFALHPAFAANPNVTAVWSPRIPDHVQNPGGMFVADCFVDPGGSTPDNLSVSILDPSRSPLFHVDLPGGVEYHLEWEAPANLDDGIYHYEVEYVSQEGDVATLRGGFLLLGQFNALCAIKFNDEDGDGVYEPDDGETLLEGWEFCGSGPVDLGCEFTDQDGTACWFDVPEGDYELCETLMAGWEPTTQEGLCQGTFVGPDDIVKLVFGNWIPPIATEQTTWGQIKNIYK